MKRFIFTAALAACTTQTGDRVAALATGSGGGALTWDDSGEFFVDGVAMGQITCSDFADDRIDGSDADFAAYVAEKCTATPTPAPPLGPEPCDPANMTFALDPGGYTIDTCVSNNGGDPYRGGIADWVQVPAWSNQFDAECWVEHATGNGCCAFYVDIDPAELSACDVVYASGGFGGGSGYGSGGSDYGGTTYGGTTYGSGSIARVAAGHGHRFITSAHPIAMVAFADDPPGNPDPLPTPPRPRPPSRVWSRIGAILFGATSIFTPLIPEELAKPIEEIYERIVEEAEKAAQNGRGPGRTAPRGGGVGAPPDPPPGWDREPFQRGGRREPPPRIPPTRPRPPDLLPPGGRPITKPGQIGPQPSPRPPYRPR